jgi:hypothetical protein
MPKPAPVRVPLKVLVEARKAIRAQWARAEEMDGGARLVLAAFLAAHFELLETDARTALALYGPPPETENERTRLGRLKAIRALMAAAEQAVAAGKKERAVREDVDPAMAAVHFLGVIHLAWTLRSMDGASRPLAAMGAGLFDQFWEGIGR